MFGKFLQFIFNGILFKNGKIFLAALLPLAAFFIQWVFWDFLQPYVWFLFYPAVFFSAWMGGLYSGLSSTFISIALVIYFFMPSQSSMSVEYFSAALFSLMGVLFSYTQERAKRAGEKNTQTMRLVESHIAELQKAKQQAENMARFPLENPNPVMRIDRQYILLYANDAAFSMLPKWNLQINQIAPPVLQKATAEVFETKKIKIAELSHEERIFSFSIAPVLSGDYANIYARDITEQKLTYDALRESEQRHRTLFENMMEGYAYCQMFYEDDEPRDFAFIAVNSAFEKLTGLRGAAGNLVSKVIPDLREKNPEIFEVYGRVALTGKAEHFEIFVKPLNGWFSISVHSPQTEYFIAIFENITERKQVESKLQLQSKALETAANAIMITDQKGRIEWVNPAWSALTGYSKEEALGKNPRILKSGKQERAFYKNLWDTILAGKVWRAEIINKRKDGILYDEEETITPVLDEHGAIKNFIAIKQNISARKQAEEKLRELSIHDTLTGLYNRRFFEEELRRIERGREFPVSIIMADVDGLKFVNDEQGHAAGDDLIKRAAQIIRAAFRSEDIVARIGGDEFAVLLPNADETIANASVRRVRQILHEQNGNHGTPVRLSLGVSSAGESMPLSAVLKKADANMYLEKQKNHNYSRNK